MGDVAFGEDLRGRLIARQRGAGEVLEPSVVKRRAPSGWGARGRDVGQSSRPRATPSSTHRGAVGIIFAVKPAIDSSPKPILRVAPDGVNWATSRRLGIA